MIKQQIPKNQTKPQAENQVSQSFSSVISSRQASLQAQIAKDMEDLQRLSCIIAGIGYHKERAR